MENPILHFIIQSIKDLFLPFPRNTSDYEEGIHLTAKWLARAQYITPDKGFSQGYYLYRHGSWGWLPSYRETTGYIIETLFDYAKVFDKKDYFDKAVDASDWLCRIQSKDGSISNPNFGNSGLVFDTGQVLFGYLAAYKNTDNKKYLEAAVKAGEWLVRTADEKGIWSINTHNNCPHVYNTRVAWALLELNKFDKEKIKYKEIAEKNLDWAVENFNGRLFENNGFSKEIIPFTHNIAYAIRGLLESAIILDDKNYNDIVLKASDFMISHLNNNGFIPSQINPDGISRSHSSCLTGDCQLSIIWYKLYIKTKEEKYLKAADKAIEFVLSKQGKSGGIKGSFPVFGRYSPMGYPNWAAKFFLEALLLKKEIKS